MQPIAPVDGTAGPRPIAGYLLAAFVLLLLYTAVLIGTTKRSTEATSSLSVKTTEELRLLLLQEQFDSALPDGSLTTRAEDSFKTLQDSKATGIDRAEALVGLELATRNPLGKAETTALASSSFPLDRDVATCLAEPNDTILSRVSSSNAQSVPQRVLKHFFLKSRGKEAPGAALVHPQALMTLGISALVGLGLVAAGFLSLLLLLVNPAKVLEGGFVFGNVSPADGNRLAARVGIALGLYILIPLLVSPLVHGLAAPLRTAAGGGCQLLAALTAITVSVEGVVDFGRLWGKFPLLRGLASAVGANGVTFLTICLLIAPMAFLQRFFPGASHPIADEIAQGLSGVGLLAVFFAASLCAPIAEELIFRAMLFPALASLTGRVRWGLLLQAFLFASLHPQGPLAWPVLMAIGGVSAFLSWKTRSIWPSILMHALHNGITLLLAVGIANL